jgi:hypothetical protein
VQRRNSKISPFPAWNIAVAPSIHTALLLYINHDIFLIMEHLRKIHEISQEILSSSRLLQKIFRWIMESSAAAANQGRRCAACKNQRRRCSQDCVLAPYFPASDPHRYACVQRIFGASNTARVLQVNPSRTCLSCSQLVCQCGIRHGNAHQFLAFFSPVVKASNISTLA